MPLILCGRICMVVSRKLLKKFSNNPRVIYHRKIWRWNKEVEKAFTAKRTSYKDWQKCKYKNVNMTKTFEKYK